MYIFIDICKPYEDSMKDAEQIQFVFLLIYCSNPITSNPPYKLAASLSLTPVMKYIKELPVFTQLNCQLNKDSVSVYPTEFKSPPIY